MSKSKSVPDTTEAKDDKTPVVTPFSHIKHLKKRRFLAAYCVKGQLVASAKAAGCNYMSHYHWLRTDPVYAEAFAACQEIVADQFEGEVFRRAFEGFDRPIHWKGQITDYYREYSDLLAIFSLKGLRPLKYRDNLPPSQNGPVSVNISFASRAEPTVINPPNLRPAPIEATEKDIPTCADEKDE